MTIYKYEDFDKERERATYKYLLFLTDPELFSNKTSKISETKIAEQWGGKSNRIFVRRVLRAVFPEFYDDKTLEPLPTLSLGRLIFILSSLQESRKNKSTSEQISKDNKNKAIRLITQIFPDEQHQIELPEHPGAEILKRIFDIARHPFQGLSLNEVNKLYNLVISRNFIADRESNGEHLYGDNSFDTVINSTINDYFENFNHGVNSREESLQRVKREISRIEFQCGLKQLDLIPKANHQSVFEKYFTSGFIRRLTYSVLENQILTDKFPIYLKYYNIEKLKPLPLYIESDDQPNGLLNSKLLEKSDDFESINGLERQFAYKVIVHFYVKVPDDYKPRFAFSDANINVFSKKERRLEFFEEISGIGSPITLIMAAIDRVLFRDIPLLKDFFYVAQEKISTIEISGNGHNSFLWSHTLVQLCKISDIENSIQNSTRYSRASNDVPIHGEYCGFDLVEVATKSALVARLRAIQQTGENPNQYLSQLCNRIEEDHAVRIGLDKINYYPFSLQAMKDFYCQTILFEKYVENKNNFDFIGDSPWSMVTYEAHLNIAEAFLKEGLYKVAKKYLDLMNFHIEKYGENIISDLMSAKYNFCLFRYSYLADLRDSECKFSDRHQAIQAAFNYLNLAEECLIVRVKKMNCIDEIQQTNFTPFCYIYSRIYEHRAKLSMFFNVYISQDSLFESLLQPIKLFEKARIYAAREGNSDLYACTSSYQAWCYLRLAYYLTEEKNIKLDINFTNQDCLGWAKKLINHSKLCYSPIGKHCYQDIKNHSGERSLENIEPNMTYSLPLIQELNKSDKDKVNSLQELQVYDPENSVLKIDFTLFKELELDDSKSTYLFGPHSSIIIFAIGMLELCESQDNREIIDKVLLAKRYFNYSSILAEDGSKTKIENNTFHVERNFTQNPERDFLPGDHVLRGLYLHRLTQFADLGLVFYIACEIIELLSNHIKKDPKNFKIHNEEKIIIIQKILSRLISNKIESPVNSSNQTGYNGHFADHYLKLNKYFNEEIVGKYKFYCNQYSDSMKIRNFIVYNFFKIMSGLAV